MVRVFCDTEFTEFLEPQLISLGAVAEDGREFYVEISDYNRKLSSDFVKQVVEPLLLPEKYAMPALKASLELGHWIEELGDEVVIAIDYGTDWQLLVDLLDVLPKNMHPNPALIYNDLATAVVIKSSQLNVPGMDQRCKEIGELFGQAIIDYMTEHQLPLHHALYDARANAAAWKRCMVWMDQVLHPI